MANMNKDTKGADKAAGSTKSAAEQEAEQKAAAQHMQARAKAEKAAKEAAESKNGRFPYTVSAGKSVTSRRGILAAGEGCTPMDFNADGALGAGAADEMWRKGYLLKDGQAHPDNKS